MKESDFEWDLQKEKENLKKHGIGFFEAQKAFLDVRRVMLFDEEHSEGEQRYFCLGMIKGGVLTVRFTLRGSKYRIIGAGFWRAGRRQYEKENKIHR